VDTGPVMAASAAPPRWCAPGKAHVIGVDLNGDAADETVELARAHGGRMDTVAPVDLATEEGAKRYIARAVEFTDKVDV
jgi:hypothetical protein